jgi:hypothetical protein
VQQQQQQPVPSPTSDGRGCGVIVKAKCSSPTGRRSDSWLIRLLHCLRGDAGYRQLMRRTASPTGVNSVSMIDKVSRVLFPTAFLCLNCVYWIGYSQHDN